MCKDTNGVCGKIQRYKCTAYNELKYRYKCTAYNELKYRGTNVQPTMN